RTCGGHLGVTATELGIVATRRSVRLGRGVELLRRGEHVPEIADRRVDLVGVDESIEQCPSVFPPGRDLVVRSVPPRHSRLLSPAAAVAISARAAPHRLTLRPYG